MQINPLDAPGTPFEIELRNPNPSSKRLQGGPVYRITFECSKEVHDAFMASREGNLRLIGRMAVLPDTDEQPAYEAVNGKGSAEKPAKEKAAKKPKEPRGPYSYHWEYIHKSGLLTYPGVTEVIAARSLTPTEPPWEVLHRIFGVGGGTLVDTDPEGLFVHFPTADVGKIRTLLDRARAFQEEKLKKAEVEANV